MMIKKMCMHMSSEGVSFRYLGLATLTPRSTTTYVYRDHKIYNSLSLINLHARCLFRTTSTYPRMYFSHVLIIPLFGATLFDLSTHVSYKQDACTGCSIAFSMTRST